MSRLNKDILISLFEELQDDSNSLFSCILVNRLWCETAIPVLWKDPWRNVINYNKSSLYYIITFYLPDCVKEFLILPISRQPLLFDYLSFCRSINMGTINNIITCQHSLSKNWTLLQQEVYNLFMRKCPEIKYLDIKSIEHQIFYLPEAKACLNSLCELKCKTSAYSSYFYGLARICNNIERLIIVNTSTKVNHGIINLIDVQKNLKYFEWRDCLFDFKDYGSIYVATFMAIAKKANTITHFIMSIQKEVKYTFPQMLPDLRNLQTLKLNIYDYQLANSVYPNLEIIHLSNFVLTSTVTCTIKNSGGHLREILFNNYKDSDEESLSLLCAISENCPLVEYLSLAFPSSEEHFIEFEKLLKACQKLRVLGVEGMDKNKFGDGKELLKVLIRSVSINLREIRLFDYFKFSLDTLVEFLEKWRGRPALSIITSDHDNVKTEHTEIFNKYKDDGVVKDFKFVS